MFRTQLQLYLLHYHNWRFGIDNLSTYGYGVSELVQQLEVQVSANFHSNLECTRFHSGFGCHEAVEYINIGIPDRVFFIFGAAVFENITATLCHIPSSAIYAKMSPPGMEVAGYGKYINCFRTHVSHFFLMHVFSFLSTIVPLSICSRAFQLMQSCG